MAEKKRGTNIKPYVLTAVIMICFCIWIITRPETVATGNGFSHQIGSFGQCEDGFSDNCNDEATHRIHHFFGNEYYCDACWIDYGQDWFERLSDVSDNDGVLDYDSNICRHSGCGEQAKYSDWDHRFCAKHLNDTHPCRYPGCTIQVPYYSSSEYCSQHD